MFWRETRSANSLLLRTLAETFIGVGLGCVMLHAETGCMVDEGGSSRDLQAINCRLKGSESLADVKVWILSLFLTSQQNLKSCEAWSSLSDMFLPGYLKQPCETQPRSYNWNALDCRRHPGKGMGDWFIDARRAHFQWIQYHMTQNEDFGMISHAYKHYNLAYAY